MVRRARACTRRRRWPPVDETLARDDNDRAAGARAMYRYRAGPSTRVCPVFRGTRPGSSSQLHGTDIKKGGAVCSKLYEQNDTLDFYRTLHTGIVDVQYELLKTRVLCFCDGTLYTLPYVLCWKLLMAFVAVSDKTVIIVYTDGP